MADGAMGFMLMAFVAIVVGCAGFIPLTIVGLVPVLRRTLLAWVVALAVLSYDFVYLAVQIRVVAGPGGLGAQIYVAGIVLAVVPILLLAHRQLAKDVRLWPFAFLPMAVIMPLGRSMMAFRERSESLIGAAQSGDHAGVLTLLREGADPGCFEIGNCAIDAAIERRAWPIVESLIEYGATDAKIYEFDDSTSKRLAEAGKPLLAKRLRANGG